MAMIDLVGRPNAAQLLVQPGDPVWLMESRGCVRGTFRSYGFLRGRDRSCIVEVAAPDGRRRSFVIDPVNVYPCGPGEGA